MNRLQKIAAVLGAAPLLAGAATAATAATGPSAPSSYTAVAPVRVLDTRTGSGAAKAPVTKTGTVTLQIAGTAGVPADATAVTLNVGVTAASASGYLTVYPDGAPRPAASALDFGPGQSVQNELTVQLVDGRVDLYNGSGGTVQFFADLSGWYTAAPAAYVPPAPVTKDLGAVASVTTGGSFATNAVEVGTVDLAAGTWQVSVNAKATPTMTSSVQVFPQFFVYDQPKNPAFAGDLFNVGSGALESGGNTNIDSYYSGSGVVTLTQPTTLHVLGFGYDSDRGAGSYALDDLTVTAVPLG